MFSFNIMQTLIVIPSYQRAKILRSHTLHFCMEMEIPMDHIYVFLYENDSQLQEYQYLRDLGVHVIYGPLGLQNMRNFITLYFPPKTQLFHMDDDIQGLYQMRVDTSVEDKKKASRYPLFELTPFEFHRWITESFEICKSKEIHMFGVYPVRNGYFMKGLPECSYNLRFCVGSFWGCLNDHEILIHLEEKEDVERTLQSFAKYQKILRWNFISPKTHYYKTLGGMQARHIDRVKASHESSLYLFQKFPEYCSSIYTGKKNGHTEVRLRTQQTSSYHH